MIDEILYYLCMLFQIGTFRVVLLKHSKLLISLPIFVICSGRTSAQFLVEVLETNSFNNHRPVVRCEATGANFGEDIMTFSFGQNAIGCAIRTIPSLACRDIHMPVMNITGCNNNFAIVPRGNCTFSEKAYRVQKAAYSAVIMYNYQNDKLPIFMSGSNFSDQVTIPVVMVNYDCMLSLTGHYSTKNGYVVTLKASPGYYELIKYLVPFVAIVGFCFAVLFTSLVIRLCRERRRLAKKRLSRSHLKKIPTRKFKNGDREETCAICLDDFQENEKLRILPCRHAYHCKCIDVWLTKNRKVCPVCKRKVGSKSNDSSDSDSERASTSTTPVVTRENDPLLRNEHPMATNSSVEFGYPQHSIPSISVNSNFEANGFTSFFIRLLRPSRFNNPSNMSTILRNSVEDDNSATVTNLYSQQQERSDLLSNFSNELQIMKNNLRIKWSHMFGRNNVNDLPHTLLDNEDTATTVTHDDLEFETTQNGQPEWDLSQSNFFSADTSAGDENSLTTVYSNHELDIESLNRPPSSED